MKQKFAIKKEYRVYKIIDTVTQDNIQTYKKLEKNTFQNSFSIGDIITNDEDDFAVVFTKDLKIKKNYNLSDKGVNKINKTNSFKIIQNDIILTPIKAKKHKYLTIDSSNLNLAKIFDKTAKIGDVAIFDYYGEIISQAKFELNYELI